MKLKDLTPNISNPRKITDDKLKMLKKSLDEFGDLGCIVFNRQTGKLVGAHQRLKVLSPDTDITITQELIDPNGVGTIAMGYALIAGEKFPIRFVQWDETKEKAAMLAANQHGGMWDYPLLTTHISELDHLNFDMDLIGFDQIELEKLLAPVTPPNIEDFTNTEPKKMKFYTCPNCEEEFEERQAMVRIE